MPSASSALSSITRRHFFQQAGFGIGSIALASCAGMPVPKPHFSPSAKSVIYLFMAGGPSQVDLFDEKPVLRERDGESIPDSVVKGERFAFIKGSPKLLGSPFDFAKRGESGQNVSSLMPHLAGIADDIAIVRSMHTEQFNHGPAQLFMNTGHQLVGRPSMGSWLLYGLGAANRDLPGFVVLLSGDAQPDGGKSCWASGFLPSVYQGVEFRGQGDPVLFLSDPQGVDRAARRRTIDAINDLNRMRLADVGDPEIATRIEQYEMAFRMQGSVPELTDIAKEPKETHELYGTTPGKTSFANNCLLARRLVQRGVRFVQLYHRGWDHHGTFEGESLGVGLPRLCGETDRAAAALVTDLKRLGLLDSTLVVWGGEFGRTPMNEARGGSSKYLGRDHHPRAFTIWMAGGGVKRGIAIGKTDEFGYAVTEDAVHVNDLHATVLHLMGFDHLKLTYKFAGRDFRLTDVAGHVVKKLLA